MIQCFSLFVYRQDLERICDDLQLEESVDDLMHQLGANSDGRISYAQFLLCHKHLQLTPVYQVPFEANMSDSENGKVCRRNPSRNGKFDFVNKQLKV